MSGTVGLLVGGMLMVCLSGCNSVYFHDAELEKQLTDAHGSLAGSTALWDTMEQNLEKKQAAELEALRASAQNRRLTELQDVGKLTWAEVEKKGAGEVQSVGTELTTTTGKVSASLDRIKELQSLINNDPSLEQSPAPAEVKAAQESDVALKAAKASLAGLAADLNKLPDYLKQASDFLAKVDNDVVPKLKQYGTDLRLDKAVETLRKADSPELIEEVRTLTSSAAALGTDPTKMALPTEFADAVNRYLGPSVIVQGELKEVVASAKGDDKTPLSDDLKSAAKAYLSSDVATLGDLRKAVSASKKSDDERVPSALGDAVRAYFSPNVKNLGDLLALVQAPDAGIKEIRLSLEKEQRRTAVELAQARLESENRRLALLHAKLLVLQDRNYAASVLALQAKKWEAVQGPLAEELTGLSRMDQNRNEFNDRLFVLMQYTSLFGSLNRRNAVIDQQMAVEDHKLAIEESRVAAAAYERLIASGVEGSLIFARGGITEEQVANALRVLQTVGIGIIAGK